MLARRPGDAYLNGIVYEPQTLRLAIVEASQGKMGTWVDQVVLRCFAFDENAGNYTFSAMLIMNTGGVLGLRGIGNFTGGTVAAGTPTAKFMIAQLAAIPSATTVPFLPLGEPGGSFWLPAAGSANARSFDLLFYTILGVCTFFFLLIVVLMAAFVFLYRSKPGGQPRTIGQP